MLNILYNGGRERRIIPSLVDLVEIKMRAIAVQLKQKRHMKGF